MKTKILTNIFYGIKIFYILIYLAVFGILYYFISKKKEGFDTNPPESNSKSSDTTEDKEDEKIKNSKIKNILKYAQYSLTLIKELNPKDFDNILKDTTTSDFEKLNNIYKVLYPKVN